MNDLMLLVLAAELERSSPEKGTLPKDLMASDSPHPTVQPQQHRYEPRISSVETNENMSPCKPQQLERQAQSIVSQQLERKPKQSPFPAATKSTKRKMTPLVKNWSEDSLNQLHDLINEIVPRDNVDTASGKRNSNTSSPTTSPIRAETVDCKWKAMFDCLAEYKKEFGSCEVPARWEQNKPLAYWVVRQRTLYRRKALAAEKVQRLEDLGFTWGFSLEKYQHELTSHEKPVYAVRRPTPPAVPKIFKTATATTSTTKKSSRSPSFLTTKQIRHLEALGLRWDCFQEKRVRFQLDEDQTTTTTKSDSTKFPKEAMATIPNRKPLVPVVGNQTRAVPLHFVPSQYQMYVPSPIEFHFWLQHQQQQQQRALQSS